jgi:hypothetical protein
MLPIRVTVLVVVLDKDIRDPSNLFDKKKT